MNAGLGNSLSAVADYIGLSLPAMSRLVDGLVEQELMGRRSCEDDRRHVRLSVTPSGKAAIDGARELAQKHLAEVVAPLPTRDRAAITAAMELLREVFTPETGILRGAAEESE